MLTTHVETVRIAVKQIVLKGGWIRVQSVSRNDDIGLIRIKFKTLDEIKKFVMEAERFEGDVLVYSGHYSVDGKSLMGILSLSLASAMNVKIIADNDKIVDFTKKVEEIGILVNNNEW